MKTTALTTTSLGDFAVTIAPTAIQAKADALALGKTITAVASAAEQQDCLVAAGIVKGLIKQMETTREEVKKPALEAGRMIDAAAKQYSADLITERDRLEKLASAYQEKVNAEAAVLRAAEEARQKRIADQVAEQRKSEMEDGALMMDRHDKERAADLPAIANATDDESRAAAMTAADANSETRAREVRERELHVSEMAANHEEEMRNNVLALQSLAPAAVTGARQRVQMDYEMLDLSALYRARPDLVKLTEKRSDILAAINIPGQPQLPGIRTFESTKVQAKALV